MAEFQEVVKQMARMCAQQKNNCEGCLLYDDEIECPVEGPPEDWKLSRFAEIERIIIKWAAEHPEPVYPSWNEWYTSTFPNTGYSIAPCPNRFGKMCDMTKYHGEVECANCRKQPISADIAEKLGIKPVEVKGDA